MDIAWPFFSSLFSVQSHTPRILDLCVREELKKAFWVNILGAAHFALYKVMQSR
jgi:hypothetical protein